MAEITFNRGAINASQCISDGWQIIKGEYGLFLGISFVAYLLISCVPIANIFLVGPVMGGIFYCLLRRMRGETVEFGDMFKGFNNYLPLMLIGLIQAIPGILLQILQFTGNLADLLTSTRSRGGDGSFFVQSSAGSSALAGGIIIIAIVIGLIFIIVGLAWTISFFFAFPLAVEHNLGAADAIRLSAKAAWSNFGGILLLLILEGLLAFVGVLALCIGVFFVAPVIYAANAVAYRQVFPAANVFTEQAPPPPTDYGTDYGRPTNYGGFER